MNPMSGAMAEPLESTWMAVSLTYDVPDAGSQTRGYGGYGGGGGGRRGVYRVVEGNP